MCSLLIFAFIGEPFVCAYHPEAIFPDKNLVVSVNMFSYCHSLDNF